MLECVSIRHKHVIQVMLDMLPMEIVKKLGMQLPMHMDHVLSRIVILDFIKKEILVFPTKKLVLLLMAAENKHGTPQRILGEPVK